MSDPISMVSGGIAIAQGALQVLSYIKDISDTNVISAFFRWDGVRVEGSERIEIEKHPQEGQDDIWWLSVKEVPEYTFVRMPVIESCVQEIVGQMEGEKNPDTRFWRWIPQARSGVIVGGQYTPPNVKVDFLIIGYRPKALIKHFSS